MHELEHAPDSPSRRVLDVRAIVLERHHEHRQRLLRDARQVRRVRAFQNSPERERRRLALAPIARSNVRLNVSHDLLHHRISHELRDETEARAPRHGEVPRVFILVLVVLLLRELLEQHRHQRAERGGDEIEHLHVRLPVLDRGLTTDLFLANRAPKFNRLQSDFVLILLGRLHRQLVHGLDVRRHVLVVVLRDPNQHLERRDAHARVLARRRLAHALHDEVALLRLFKILVRKVQRVIQRLRRRQPHADVRFPASHRAHHRREHPVHVRLIQIVRVHLLAHVPERLQARLLRARVAPSLRPSLQARYQIRPRLERHLRPRDLRHHLRRDASHRRLVAR